MKILGIDYGRRKMGVAIGDSTTGLVEPLKTVLNSQLPIINFQKIFNDQMVKKVVIGVPGGKIEKEIREFGDKLKKETSLPVEYFDETLSTQDAQRVLIESGGSRKKRKEKEDAVAAAIMLQSYMETRLH